MANRRMTSRHITSTVQFTAMPAGARALYLHLMDESDDDVADEDEDTPPEEEEEPADLDNFEEDESNIGNALNEETPNESEKSGSRCAHW